MILSVSRRTDIPNWYSAWFYNRIREGFLYVRNPFNSRQISRIPLSPDLVDCIVFWTKNPKNMMPRLGELQDYDFLFQFTLTGYGKDVEPGVPDKKHMIGVFRALSEQIGHERVIWRYDPILLSERYTPEYHLKAFREIAERLAGYTDRVVISFVDFYAKMKKNAEKLRIRPITEREMTELAGKMAEAAGQNQMSIEACAEQTDLSGAGVKRGSCIDRSLIEKLTDCRLAGGKDRNQRKECGCMESIEVGAYDTCRNGCLYCYAGSGMERLRAALKQYDVNSPLLCGCVGPEDKITERNIKSLKIRQISLFDGKN